MRNGAPCVALLGLLLSARLASAQAPPAAAQPPTGQFPPVPAAQPPAEQIPARPAAPPAPGQPAAPPAPAQPAAPPSPGQPAAPPSPGQPPPWQMPPARIPPPAVPPVRFGFQMALRTGYSLPMGNFDAAHEMSNFSAGQVPFITDIGTKILPNLFVGGYLGLGFGGPAGTHKQACEADGGNCVALNVKLGIELQYHFLPGSLANPWIGYGCGLDSVAETETHGAQSTNNSYGGVDFARLMAGVDFRINHVFGVGPFVDLALGEYTTSGSNSVNNDIPNKATHEWLTFGARFVFFP